MTNHVMLNNEQHLELKVKPKFTKSLGHEVGRVVVLPNEIDPLHVEFPLLFTQNETKDGFHCIALMGFSAEENLFLKDEMWNASQIPLLFAKGPFVIGFQNELSNSDEGKKAVLLIDTDDERVSEDKGNPLFLEFGGQTPYLENIQSVMQAIDEGMQLATQFSTMLHSLELLEPITMDVAVTEEHNVHLEGYYTISNKRLAELDDSTLVKLQKTGFLRLIHLAQGSLSNMPKLITLKQQRLQA